MDTVREDIAVLEAARLNIPIVAITDTNADPSKIAYPIAGNDDAIRSIRIILDVLADAVAEGSSSGRKEKNPDSKQNLEAVSA